MPSLMRGTGRKLLRGPGGLLARGSACCCRTGPMGQCCPTPLPLTITDTIMSATAYFNRTVTLTFNIAKYQWFGSFTVSGRVYTIKVWEYTAFSSLLPDNPTLPPTSFTPWPLATFGCYLMQMFENGNPINGATLMDNGNVNKCFPLAFNNDYTDSVGIGSMHHSMH